MFIAMNNFKVVGGKEADFEDAWRKRETYLHEVPGFVRFALLKADDGAYISHTTWESRAAFEAWTKSEAFSAAHRQGGSMMGVLEGPPQVRLFEAVIEQELAKA